MEFLMSLVENTATVFFAALATAIAQRIVSSKRKKDEEKPPRIPKRKGGSSR